MTHAGTGRPRWDAAARSAFLATLPLFGELSAPAREALAARLRPRRLRRGEYLFHEGAPAAHVQLLAEGRIKIVRETGDGQEVILRLIRPGEIFGGAGGWGGATYPASAVAGDDAVVLRLAADEFVALLGAHPEVALALLRELGGRLREAEARILDLQTERVERRIARALLRLANKTGVKSDRGIELGLPLSRQDLAELAGTTLSTASRTLSEWDQRGLVDAGRERVTILRPHALVAIAEELPGAEPDGE
ncbi:MAG TPA: Crp/Fnr family transcriptional regulator [Thermomicrobiales bacterium]|nr:Crp/Fnr family transcriptional regulator [Thermomicrobiales bacterium]